MRLKQIAKQNAAHFSPSQGLFGGSLPGILKMIVSRTLLFGLLTKIKCNTCGMCVGRGGVVVNIE